MKNSEEIKKNLFMAPQKAPKSEIRLQFFHLSAPTAWRNSGNIVRQVKCL